MIIAAATAEHTGFSTATVVILVAIILVLGWQVVLDVWSGWRR